MNSELDHVLSQLRSMRDGQQARVDHARQLLNEAEGELKRIEAMIAASGVRPTRQRRQASEQGVSPEAVEQVREAIRNATWDDAMGDLPGSFTSKQVHDVTGLAISTARRALDVLRAEGVVRLAGQHSINGTRPSMVFVREGGSDGA